MKNYYEILDVPKTSSAEEIKKAYRRLASAYHPDKYPENTKFAEDMMKQINAAFAVLSDLSKRNQYDAWLNAQEPLSGDEGNTKQTREEGGKKNYEDSNARKESDRNNTQKNNYKAHPSNKNIFDVDLFFLKKYWYIPALVVLMIIADQLSSNKTTETKTVSQSIVQQNSDYKMTLLPKSTSDFKLKTDENGFSINLFKDRNLGYYQLFVNGENDPSVTFAHISNVIEIRKNDVLTGYILQAECGGNGCGSEYLMIDLENKVKASIPINKGNFYTDASGIYVDGFNGINKLGDPLPVKLNYVVTNWSGTKSANWIDSSLDSGYANLIGKHPTEFFGNTTLRAPMIASVGESIFRIIRDNTQVAGPIEVVNGSLLVLNGCKPHACNSDSAVTIINGKSGAITTLYRTDGNLSVVGNLIDDQLMNIGGFSFSAYAQIFNEYLRSNNLTTKIKIAQDGKVLFIN